MANISKRGNSYTIRISIGYDVKGKQLKKNFTWIPKPGMTVERQNTVR